MQFKSSVRYDTLLESQIKGKQLTAQQTQKKQELLAAIGLAVLNLPNSTAGQGTIPYDGLMHVPSVNVLGRQHPAMIKPVHLLERGELQRPLERVQPALPASLAEATGHSPKLLEPFGSRQQLAQWLTRANHPLTARVMVNRIWQWHFGHGIVRTANDFGAMGEPPTHPDLLDWLALRFMKDGWSI